ncbi:MAG: hypothetical protein PHY93_10705 [Bacteriovorax sp.]|nr:hypothetical protein [Bacteriovorax sp.]
MKKIFTALMLTLALLNAVCAEDLSSIDVLIRQGLQVKMGELTGAGSKFSVHNLAGLVLPDGVLMKEDCSAIIVRASVDPKVSDIIRIKVQDHEIEASEFIGFVVR